MEKIYGQFRRKWNIFNRRIGFSMRGLPSELAALNGSHMGWSKAEAVISLAQLNEIQRARFNREIVLN